jgi:5-oxopent-3-ene-1,2,5-tricarboxylate decarboxylase / 2-hydroxyhepta-2,4-diene-1,7-dioate isomerase
MKLLRFLKNGRDYAGLRLEEGIIDLKKSAELYRIVNDPGFIVPENIMEWVQKYSSLYSTLDKIVVFLRKHNLVKEVLRKDVKLLAPIDKPSKIICLGLNYSEHAAETGYVPPSEPVIFAKVSETINDPEGEIICSDSIGRVDPEAELAFIISREAKNLKKENAFEYVLGYTVVNDFTARDIQSADMAAKKPWFRSKNFDGFCPIGPEIVFKEDVEDPHRLNVRLEVNGEVRQNDSTENLIFNIPEMLEHITSMMTLKPGDIVATGTPSGIREVVDGDVMEVIVEGIGRLRNTVRIL